MKRILSVFALSLLFIVFGIAEDWTIEGVLPGISQEANAQYNSFQDPCTQQPHQVAVLPAAATPTAKLITGVTGTTTYVCALHYTTQVAAATPGAGINVFYGTGTTCGTGNVTLGKLGNDVAGKMNNITNGNGSAVFVAPTATDVCIVQNTTALPMGWVEYVQK